MKKRMHETYAVISCYLLGSLLLIAGVSALASAFMFQPVASEKYFTSLSLALLVTGLVYCILAALCFWSAWALTKQTRKAAVIAAVTLSLVGIADCWDLFRDIQTGVSMIGIVSFVIIAALSAVVLIHLLQSKHEVLACLRR